VRDVQYLRRLFPKAWMVSVYNQERGPARHEVRYCTVIHLHRDSLEYLFILLRTLLHGYGLQCFSYEGDSSTSTILQIQDADRRGKDS
jgi:hypothetical protein